MSHRRSGLFFVTALAVSACGAGADRSGSTDASRIATVEAADSPAGTDVPGSYPAETLYLLAQPGDAAAGGESLHLLIAGPLSVSVVRLCKSPAATDCGAATAGVIQATADVRTAGRAYYRTPTALRPASGDVLTLVGTDAAGAVVARSVVRLVDLSQPVQPVPALQPGQDVPLRGADGGSTSLAKVFKGKYMLLDLSGASCGGCIQLARMIAGDTELGRIFESGKCSHATVVDDLSGWLGRFPAAGPTGRHSYESTEGLRGVAKRFGVNLQYTPTVILIDATGKVLNTPGASIPGNFKTLCQ